MSSESLIKSLLELIAASGDQTETRIRIQKEAFLLAVQGFEGLSVRNFDYHHYGPFNRSLSDALNTAVNLSLLIETREIFENGMVRYGYQLTPAGEDWVSRESPRFRRMNASLAKMRNEHWRALELAATAVFLEKRHKLDSRDVAFSEAMKRKPETRPYEPQARSVLSELGI